MLPEKKNNCLLQKDKTEKGWSNLIEELNQPG
jgi:hypothetical protein